MLDKTTQSDSKFALFSKHPTGTDKKPRSAVCAGKAEIRHMYGTAIGKLKETTWET
jgi:hypothetical protein